MILLTVAFCWFVADVIALLIFRAFGAFNARSR